MNIKNRNYYENMSAETLEEFSRKSGISHGEDIQAIKELIDFNSPDVNIIDIGCGTGRAIKYFIKNMFMGKIYGIDLNESFIVKTKKEISSKRVSLRWQSFLNLDEKENTKYFNYSLLLFSVITEFNKNETKLLFKKLCKITKNFIFVDFIEDISKSNVQLNDNGSLYLKGEWGEYHGTYFNEKSCIEIENNHKCTLINIISYRTSSKTERKMAVFKPY